MKSSYLNIHQALLKQSLCIPELVNLSARKDNAFINTLSQWLLITEDVMKTNEIAQCAELAGLRSKIIAADYYVSVKGNSKKKHQLSVSTKVIFEAQSTLLRVLEPIEHRINEAKEAIRQLLGVAYQANMIDPKLEFNILINTLWSGFANHEQLKGVTAKILVLISQSDALRLLAEEIDLSICKT